MASTVSKVKTETTCLNNIRRIGQTFSAYVAETDGPITHWYYGAQLEGVSVHWQHPLTIKKYLTASDLTKCRCPSIPPQNAYNLDHYAFNLGDPFGRTEQVPPALVAGNTASLRYLLYSKTHPEPSKSILFADASTASAGTLRLFKSGLASDGRIQLRHRGKASLFFLDGHVELANRSRLYELGIREIYTETYQFETLLSAPQP